MERNGVARRDLLRWGIGASGGGLLTSVSGCMNVPGVEGRENTSQPSYAQWIPSQPSNYGFYSLDLAEFYEQDRFLSMDIEPILANISSNYGFSLDELESITGISLETSSIEILTGSFSSNLVEEEIESQFDTVRQNEGDDSSTMSVEFASSTSVRQYEEPLVDTEQYENFTIYIPQSEGQETPISQTIAVTDGTIILAPSSDIGFERIVQRVIDTKQDESSRYIDENEDFELLSAHLGENTADTGSVITGDNESNFSSQHPEPNIYGESWSIDGETSISELVFIFQSENDVDTSFFEDSNMNHPIITSSGFNVESDGRALIGSGEFDTGEADNLPSSPEGGVFV